MKCGRPTRLARHVTQPLRERATRPQVWSAGMFDHDIVSHVTCKKVRLSAKMKDARNANDDDDDDEVAEGIALQSDSCMCRGTPEDGGSGVWGLVRLTPQKDFPRRAKEKIRTRPRQ